MTVYQNMSFALKVRKISKDVIDRKVNEVAEMLGLAELLDRNLNNSLEGKDSELL